MEMQRLEAMRHALSVKVSDLARASMDADDAGDRARSDELWRRMQQVREELRRVDAIIEAQSNAKRDSAVILKDVEMRKFVIESKAGVVFGVYEAHTPQDAFELMVADAGDGYDCAGRRTAGTPEDWIIREVSHGHG